MIEALVTIFVALVALYIGYKWGSHEATNNAVKTIEEQDQFPLTGEFYASNPIPEGFDVKKDGAALLDDPVPVKEVIPTYYEYDKDGVPTGETKAPVTGEDVYKSAIVKDPIYGDIRVYREFIASKDAIEYTIFFRLDGAKKRLDMLVTMEDIENFQREWPDTPVEQTIISIFHQRVELGEYVDATKAIPDMPDVSQPEVR